MNGYTYSKSILTEVKKMMNHELFNTENLKMLRSFSMLNTYSELTNSDEEKHEHEDEEKKIDDDE